MLIHLIYSIFECNTLLSCQPETIHVTLPNNHSLGDTCLPCHHSGDLIGSKEAVHHLLWSLWQQQFKPYSVYIYIYLIDSVPYHHLQFYPIKIKSTFYFLQLIGLSCCNVLQRIAYFIFALPIPRIVDIAWYIRYVCRASLNDIIYRKKNRFMYYPMYIQLPNVSISNIDLTLPLLSPRLQSFLIQMALVLYNGFWIYSMPKETLIIAMKTNKREL